MDNSSINSKSLSINTLGGHRQIDYGSQIENLKVTYSTFAINSHGNVVIVCGDVDSQKSKLLLYSPDGSLLKKFDCHYEMPKIGLSDEAIFMVIKYAQYPKTFKIQSFDLNMAKVHNATYTSSTDIHVFYTIDVCNDRIYFKFRTESTTPDYSYLIFILDKNLNKLDSFRFGDSNYLYGLRVRNDILVYYSIHTKQYKFYVRSLQTRELLSQFDLGLESDIDYDIGPDGNLFVLVKKQSLVNEYNQSGQLLGSTKLQSEPLTWYHLRITDNFDFAINDTKEKIIYLNS